MLALVDALKTWKHYPIGSKVLAYSDNVNLRYWDTSQNLSGSNVRWLASIGVFDLNIVHIHGVTNTAAEASL